MFANASKSHLKQLSFPFLFCFKTNYILKFFFLNVPYVHPPPANLCIDVKCEKLQAITIVNVNCMGNLQDKA